MYVPLNGFKSEYNTLNYLKYAAKLGEIEFVCLGNKQLYELYLTTNKTRINSVTQNHKSMHSHLLKTFGEETLVTINGRQVRRNNVCLDAIPYPELQDQLVGDFVFIDRKINQLIILDVTYLKNNDEFCTKLVHKKMLKMKRRCYLYKAIAARTVGKGGSYLSIVWNDNVDLDLLEFIRQSHEENKILRGVYNKTKLVKDNVSNILTRIHVKTNVDLDDLQVAVPSNIY